MKNLIPVLFLAIIVSSCTHESTSLTEFLVSIEDSVDKDITDGRLLLYISDNNDREPRLQARDGYRSQQVFGIDVENWMAGESQLIGAKVFGYPLENMTDLPSGKYYIQALFHKYETFNLASGHTVKLPMDRGEGQNMNRAPGNLYSKVIEIDFDPKVKKTFEIELSEVNPPIREAEDTEFIKHIKIESKLLSEFWGRPMHLGAHILLPDGFDEHPDAQYPICVFHGHFPSDFGGFSTEEPVKSDNPVYNERFGLSDYPYVQQKAAYDFYKQWTSKDFPRMIIIEIQHQNPYYDDSYAVNSANLGPYGDAITYELIPYIEEQYRGLGKGWARFLYGGSTGGWEALAVQVLYPDEYNGCFAACPDPIDFRAYTQVNIYEDNNGYYQEGPFARLPFPGHRDYLGHISSTIKDQNHLELVKGTNSRSGGQWDIWQAVYSPQGHDGYPKPIWDKLSGEIDKDVANYWKENYDLRYILERDWETLGPLLEGKIHIYCGDMDNYYLNNAVYLMEDFLESTTNPYYAGEVAYGDRAEHCWNGDPELPNHLSRLQYNEMYIPKILKRIKAAAPLGADLSSWRY
ncbi:MAG: alpha/beta hydrolase-fold protein [Bacteroidales bacterium]|nr:alpha/beta hydrolase-fold protein [Bacteroidales bacterium]